MKVPFTGERYESVQQAMVSLIEQLERHEYHGPKFKKLCKRIATDSRRYIICFIVLAVLIFIARSQSIKRGNPKAHGFKLKLD